MLPLTLTQILTAVVLVLPAGFVTLILMLNIKKTSKILKLYRLIIYFLLLLSFMHLIPCITLSFISILINLMSFENKSQQIITKGFLKSLALNGIQSVFKHGFT